MNKAQKIIVACTLLTMCIILTYPPVALMVPSEGQISVYEKGRRFVFLFPIDRYSQVNNLVQVNTKKLVVELLAIGFLGGAFVVLFSLIKKHN